MTVAGSHVTSDSLPSQGKKNKCSCWDVEEKYIEPFSTQVDYFVDTTHDYELGVYKGEIDKFVAEGKVSYEDIPFMDMVNSVGVVSKSLIPDTSLMWEFVDRED